MSWRLAKSLEVLRSQVDEAYPNRNKASDGTIGDAAHAAGPSDHNPTAAGVVCALDLTHSPPILDAHALADRLLAVRHPDLKYLISNYRIAGGWSGWKWEPYTGADPHFNHIHISVGVGPDGQSDQPYDDTNKWNVKGDTMDALDITKAYRIGLHRDPENDGVISAWVGKSYKELADSFGGSKEWQEQNAHLAVYAELVKQAQAGGAAAQAKLDQIKKIVNS